MISSFFRLWHLLLWEEFVTGPQKGVVHLVKVPDGAPAIRAFRQGVKVEQFQSGTSEALEAADMAAVGHVRDFNHVQADRAGWNEVSVPDYVFLVLHCRHEVLK